MITVLGHLQLRPGGAQRLRNALVAHTSVVRALEGCLHYAVGPALDDPDRLWVSERWRDLAAQSAHLIGDHMPRFNVAMRIVTVVEGTLDAYDGGRVRKMLEVPAKRFRAEYKDPDMVIVLGTVKLASGEVDRLKPPLVTTIAATRQEDGCDLYAFARDVLAPDTLHIAERWRDEAALATHLKGPHVAALNTAWAAARVEAMTVTSYNGTGERLLMSR